MIMMLGVRAHDFGKLPAEELAAKISEKGFSSVQLALSKAIAGLDQKYGHLNPGLAYHVRKAFDRHNIQIATLGCYNNLIHPDREERKELINKFKEHIRYARDFGCSVVATETGSMNADYSFNTENRSDYAFKILLESVKEIVEEAEKFGVIVGIEGVTQHVVYSPERMKELLSIVGSNNLQVVFDPVNFLSPEIYINQDDIIEKSIKLFGERMVAIHVKDFKVENGKIYSVQPGCGSFNYKLLFDYIKINKPYINLLLEDADLNNVGRTMEFLQSIYNKEVNVLNGH
jgi:L-ribulose-5-phosphate 3-epimerase